MISLFKKKQQSECYFCKQLVKTDTYKYFNKNLDICQDCLKNIKKLQTIVDRFNKG